MFSGGQHEIHDVEEDEVYISRRFPYFDIRMGTRTLLITRVDLIKFGILENKLCNNLMSIL